MKIKVIKPMSVNFLQGMEAEYKSISDKGDFQLSIMDGRVSQEFGYTYKMCIEFPNTKEGSLERFSALSDHLVQPEETIEEAAESYANLMTEDIIILRTEEVHRVHLGLYDGFKSGVKSNAARNYWSKILRQSDLKK